MIRFIIYVALVTLSSNLAGQPFEGTVRLFFTHTPGEWVSVNNERYNKITMQQDSLTEVTLLHDKKQLTTTIYRRRGEDKFGFVSNAAYYGADSADPTATTDQEFSIREIEYPNFATCPGCKAYRIHGPGIEAEAIAQPDSEIRLSQVFPSLFNNGDASGRVRQLANKVGLLVGYKEMVDGKTVMEFTLETEENQLASDAFEMDPDYVVLNETTLKALHGASFHDPVKKKEFDAFSRLFNKN